MFGWRYGQCFLISKHFPLSFWNYIFVILTFGRTRGGGGGLNFIKRILSGHLSISVAVRLSLRHIYCEFGENRHIHIGDIK